MKEWFIINQIDDYTYIISECHHWDETHFYLLNGTEYSLLIDTGLGFVIFMLKCKGRLTDLSWRTPAYPLGPYWRA